MKKTITWDMKQSPLSVTCLNVARENLAKEPLGTKLCIENVEATDLQLMINALSLYHGIGKEMRDLQTAIGRLCTGQKLIFDKVGITKEPEKVTV